jgi:hypothetical protein
MKKEHQFKFVVGQSYEMAYVAWCDSRPYNVRGSYELIANRGKMKHFFDNQRGIDLLLSKEEALNRIEAAK